MSHTHRTSARNPTHPPHPASRAHRYLNAGDLLRLDADTQLLFVAELLKGLGLKPRGAELTAALAAVQGAAAAPGAGARAARGERGEAAGEAAGGRRAAAGGSGRVSVEREGAGVPVPVGRGVLVGGLGTMRAGWGACGRDECGTAQVRGRLM